MSVSARFHLSCHHSSIEGFVWRSQATSSTGLGKQLLNRICWVLSV